MRTTNDVLRELKRRIGDMMWHNALNIDVTEARAKLGEGLVRRIENRISRGGSAIEAANDCHLDIPLDNLALWAAFYRVAADCIAARENADCASAPAGLPATA